MRWKGSVLKVLYGTVNAKRNLYFLATFIEQNEHQMNKDL